MDFQIPSARLRQVHSVRVPRPSHTPRRPHPILALSTLACPAPTGSAPRSRPAPFRPRPRRKHSRAPGPAAHRGPALGAALVLSPAVPGPSPHGSRRARAGGASSGAQVGAEAARGVLGDLPGLGLSRSMLRWGRALVHGERGE